MTQQSAVSTNVFGDAVGHVTHANPRLAVGVGVKRQSVAGIVEEILLSVAVHKSDWMAMLALPLPSHYSTTGCSGG